MLLSSPRLLCAARLLVPGDVIELKIGDVIPADAVLLDGTPVQVDQAALTGESLPVTVQPWGQVLMGSALKRGEIKAVVGATGRNTFFGKAAGMINSVQTVGHLAKVLLSITIVLLIISVVLCAIIFAKLYTTDDPAGYVPEAGKSKVIASLSVVIVILVASIPIAIEVVCTSTLAVGSHMMSRSKVRAPPFLTYLPTSQSTHRSIRLTPCPLALPGPRR